MTDPSNCFELPSDQEAIRAECFDSRGTFIEFTREEAEDSIPARFERIVRLHPERVAVVTRNHTLKYAELNEAANKLAHAILLREAGDRPIALLLNNGAPLIAGILGILKAGRTFVVLDPSLPKARLEYILEDSQSHLVVVNTDSVSMAKEVVRDAGRLMNVDEFDSGVSLENTFLPVSPDALSCIVYTSGSTGRPKGVMQNHRNGLHDTRIYTNGYYVSSRDRVVLIDSLSGGHGLKVMLSALLNGAALCPFDLRTEGVNQLTNWLVQQAITLYFSVPVVFRDLAKTLTGEEQFPELRLIHLTSDSVMPGDVELYRKHFSETCILVTKLGATETGSLRWYFIDGREGPDFRDGVPGGYAVEDTDVLLLDEKGKDAGFNCIGEIAVRSRFVSPGYWRLPELTRTRFLPGPEGGDQRIYLTGDLGRMEPDGCLHLMGRTEHYVKIRGYSVAVAEIEVALLGLNSIAEVVVLAREDSSGEKQLIAYLVPAGNPAPGVSELRNFLKEKLPDYMIPSAVVVVDAMPRLHTGKVDRRALDARLPVKREPDVPSVSPRTVVESTVAGIWAEVLSIDQIGVHDNFFELGGHSLSATRVLSRIFQKFRVDLPVRSLFQSPTIAEMAAVIIDSQAKALHDRELERIVTELESMSDQEGRAG